MSESSGFMPTAPDQPPAGYSPAVPGEAPAGEAPGGETPGRGTFRGTGGELLVTFLKNHLLTFLTLGIYFAWARARLYHYFYDNTEFAGHRFRFTGNGKEIFMGMLRALGILLGLGIALSVITVLGSLTHNKVISILTFLPIPVAFFFLVPVSIFGAMRYRFTRARYREISFALDGSVWEFAKEAAPKMLLSMITLGIAGPLFTHWRIGKIYNNLRYGNLRFHWDAPRYDYWLLALKGFFLTVLTLGVYHFFWYPKMFAFVRDHLRLEENRFRGSLLPGEYFRLMATNFLLVLCTLGVGTPWVMVRTVKFFIERLELENPSKLEAAVQNAGQAGSAGGEMLAQAMDLGVGLGF